jgi:hypothetical protein
MNASFRTAFWALCLGLTVPMVLFVGVELMSGGKARRASSAAAAEKKSSLRTQFDKPSAKKGGSDSATGRSPGGSEIASAHPSEKAATSDTRSGDVVLDPLEVDPADPEVVLGPGVEADSSASRDRRVPANSVAETRPKVHIDPKGENGLQANGASITALETRLTGIQQGLDKLGRAIDAQAQREPLPDPIKQATELLKQLQEARLINQPIPRDESVAAKQDADEPASRRASTGLPARKPETTSDADGPEPGTRIYHPRYLSGKALQSLIAPLLTPHVGRAGAADPATSETEGSSGETSAPSSADALVVRDLPDVLRKIDALFHRLDAPPENLVIEAVVLSVQLNDGRPNGIDLLEFNGPMQPFTMTAIDPGSTGGGSHFASGAGTVDDPLKLTRRYGLKRGILNGDPQAYIGALQAAAQARRIDAWQMTVANRESAGLMLTDPFATGGSVDQPAIGTILKIRPHIVRDGIVHLDVRQDASLDSVAAAGNRAAALTNRFSLHNGQTAVIAGFFADQSVLQIYRPSGIGGIPVFGNLFCKQFAGIERTEAIVLLTPHFVSPAPEQQYSRAGRPVLKPAAPAKPPSPVIVPVSASQERKPPSKLRVPRKYRADKPPAGETKN